MEKRIKGVQGKGQGQDTEPEIDPAAGLLSASQPYGGRQQRYRQRKKA